jgi:hypothetical protein
MYFCLSYPAHEAHSPNYIVICGLSGSTIFFTIHVNGMIAVGKVTEHRMCFFFYFLYNFYLKYFSLREELGEKA